MSELEEVVRTMTDGELLNYCIGNAIRSCGVDASGAVSLTPYIQAITDELSSRFRNYRTRITELEDQLSRANSLIQEQQRKLASRMLPSKNKGTRYRS